MFGYDPDIHRWDPQHSSNVRNPHDRRVDAPCVANCTGQNQVNKRAGKFDRVLVENQKS